MPLASQWRKTSQMKSLSKQSLKSIIKSYLPLLTTNNEEVVEMLGVPVIVFTTDRYVTTKNGFEVDGQRWHFIIDNEEPFSDPSNPQSYQSFGEALEAARQSLS